MSPAIVSVERIIWGILNLMFGKNGIIGNVLFY